jgi:predicted choloylglycine hydrolase
MEDINFKLYEKKKGTIKNYLYAKKEMKYSSLLNHEKVIKFQRWK